MLHNLSIAVSLDPLLQPRGPGGVRVYVLQVELGVYMHNPYSV